MCSEVQSMKRNEQKSPSTFLYILNISARLVLICAVIAFLVATVNYFTKDVIAENQNKATREAISGLYTDAEINITEMEKTDSQTFADSVETIYEISTSGSGIIGYCVKLSPMGFKGKVDLLVAVGLDGLISGVEIISTNDETSGIGTKVTAPSFTGQFVENSDNIISDNASDYIIAGATKTSKPVSQAIIHAKDAIKKILESSNISGQEVAYE